MYLFVLAIFSVVLGFIIEPALTLSGQFELVAFWAIGASILLGATFLIHEYDTLPLGMTSQAFRVQGPIRAMTITIPMLLSFLYPAAQVVLVFFLSPIVYVPCVLLIPALLSLNFSRIFVYVFGRQLGMVCATWVGLGSTLYFTIKIVQ